MDVLERMEKPTPKFFRVLRTIGIGVTAVGGAILTAPVTLPAALMSLAGYLVVGGTVATIVSQTVIKDVDDEDDLQATGGPITHLGANPLLDPER